MSRPVLSITLFSPGPGQWGARGELMTADGPVIFCVQAPADFVRKYVQLKMAKATVSGFEIAGDEVGFLSAIKKRVSAAQKWAVKQVVQQAAAVAKAALPSAQLKIIQQVAEKTGIAPKGSLVSKAFDLGAKALSGDELAKKAILKVARAARTNPQARAILATIQSTAKLLPAVRPIAQASEELLAGNPLGALQTTLQATVAPQVAAGLALARGDLQGAVQAARPLAMNAALAGNPLAALALLPG